MPSLLSCMTGSVSRKGSYVRSLSNLLNSFEANPPPPPSLPRRVAGMVLLPSPRRNPLLLLCVPTRIGFIRRRHVWCHEALHSLGSHTRVGHKGTRGKQRSSEVHGLEISKSPIQFPRGGFFCRPSASEASPEPIRAPIFLSFVGEPCEVRRRDEVCRVLPTFREQSRAACRRGD